MSKLLASEVAQTDLLATFFVRNTLCAVDAASIQEVIRLGLLTPVRHAPEEVAGIINLRGKVVTILDLGFMLSLPKATLTPTTRVLIMEDRNEYIGLLVDQVDEVIESESEQWQPAPANIAAGQAQFLKGVWRKNGRVLTILDAARLLTAGAL